MKEIIEKMKKNLTPEYITAVTEINIESIEKNYRNPKILLYVIPLIEKTIIETLKYNPIASIEVDSQGTYRTLNSILNDEKSMIIYSKTPTWIIDFVKWIFSDNGIRNKIMHHHEVTINYLIIEECICVLTNLMIIYNTIRLVDFKSKTIKIEFIDI